MFWIENDEDEHYISADAVPQNETLQPWWRVHRRRRSRSPLYSEPGDVCEYPDLIVEAETSEGPVFSEEFTELLTHISDVMANIQIKPPINRLRPSEEANITIRNKLKTKRINRRRFKRVNVFQIYQFCNCPDHVCPKPHLFR